MAKNTEFTFKALDSAAADKAIKSILTRGAALRKLLHETAVGILMHSKEHNDPRKLQPLRLAIRATQGRNNEQAFVDWVAHFSALKWDEEMTDNEGKKIGGFVYDKTADMSKWNIDKDEKNAQNTPFWDFEKDRNTAVVPFDLLKAVANAVKNAQSRMKDGKPVTHSKLIAILDAIPEVHKVTSGEAKPEEIQDEAPIKEGKPASTTARKNARNMKQKEVAAQTA